LSSSTIGAARQPIWSIAPPLSYGHASPHPALSHLTAEV
jgi:hypothetical protein